MNKALFILLALSLLSLAHAVTLTVDQEESRELLTTVIRQTRRCTCKCFISKRGRRLTRRLCSSGRRKVRCELLPCVKGAAAKKGLSCCRKKRKMPATPEPSVEA